MRKEKDMGICFSGDVKGGKQAVGGVHGGGHNNNAAHKDAVDYFFRARDQYPLSTQIEV